MKGRLYSALILTGVLAIAGCSASTVAVNGPAEDAVPVEGAAAAPRTLTWVDWPSATDGVITDRGYVAKSVGEVITIENPSTGAPSARILVQSIEVGATCTNVDADPPLNGQWVRVDLQAETAADLEQAMGSPELFLADWGATDANGIDTNADLITESSAWCLTKPEDMPTIIEPSTRAMGSLMLDMPFVAGTVVLHSYHGESWQFQLPG